VVNCSPRPAFAENKNLATALATLSIYICTGGGWQSENERITFDSKEGRMYVVCDNGGNARGMHHTRPAPARARAIPVTSIAHAASQLKTSEIH
jgi:hypothetical protein